MSSNSRPSGLRQLDRTGGDVMSVGDEDDDDDVEKLEFITCGVVVPRPESLGDTDFDFSYFS